MATLHLFCGKIAAGKSTLAGKLAGEHDAVLISQDHWLSRLFPGEITTMADYDRCSARLRAAIAPHIVDLLRAGVSVSLDFPANTPADREWMRTLFEDGRADHQLHFLDLPDAACMERLHRRNAGGQHDYVVSDAEFHEFTAYFEPPGDAEGFRIVRHDGAG